MTFSAAWNLKMNLVKEFTGLHTTVWFRGHANDTFPLSSGLFRESGDLNQLLLSEQVKYRVFWSTGHAFHKERDWNLLYLMQHHGVRTRLLDWSESFSTALFFAFINWNWSNSNCCVYMLAPVGLNRTMGIGLNSLYTPDKDKIYENLLYENESFFHNSIALYPIRNNQRIIAQQGVFTLQGNALIPLEEEYNGQLIKDNILIKLVFTPDMFQDIRSFLLMTGVNHFSLFPDLDGLSKTVNNPIYASYF